MALELTGGGVDHVLDVGGATTMAQSINALRTGGTVSMDGFLSGLTIPEFDVTSILQKAATIRGSQVGNREHFENMNRAIFRHRLHPVIDRYSRSAESAKPSHFWLKENSISVKSSFKYK
ncbi:hypothetical protein GMA19_00431 [Paenibacillus polymyxa E681]|nr:hypothetical protein GE561_00432 [Paenibacillus polymyxa E681]QNV60119.1 hypothetical protein GMA19_00431 [Paenibacillus polymyxa E681]